MNADATALIYGKGESPVLPESVKVVAEIGCSHGGDLKTAIKMISVAAACGASFAKFQKRAIQAIPPEIGNRERHDEHAYGRTEYEHREALEFSMAQHYELKNACRTYGVGYACSAWDERSYWQLVDLGVDFIKIPSAKNVEFSSWALGGLPLHVSLGMTTEEERDLIMRPLPSGSVPYACTSKYPCKMEETFLLEIPKLKKKFGRVGFSGHHNGIAIDLGAVMLGVDYIERHFTLDRSAKGTDHAASLEPQGLLKLCRDIEALHKALKEKPSGVPECEKAVRLKHRGAHE